MSSWQHDPWTQDDSVLDGLPYTAEPPAPYSIDGVKTVWNWSPHVLSGLPYTVWMPPESAGLYVELPSGKRDFSVLAKANIEKRKFAFSVRNRIKINVDISRFPQEHDGNLMPPLMQGGLNTKYAVVDVPYMVCTSQKIAVTPNTSYLIEFETSYSENTYVLLYYYDTSGNMVHQTSYPVQGGVTITVPQNDDISELFIVFRHKDYANITPQDFTNVKMTQV